MRKKRETHKRAWMTPPFVDQIIEAAGFYGVRLVEPLDRPWCYVALSFKNKEAEEAFLLNPPGCLEWEFQCADRECASTCNEPPKFLDLVKVKISRRKNAPSVCYYIGQCPRCQIIFWWSCTYYPVLSSENLL